MISYLGTWAIADQAGITTENLRHRLRTGDQPAPDALIGAEITTEDNVIPAGGRTVAGWAARHVDRAARALTDPNRRRTRAQPVRYVGVAQLATRWDTARDTVDAALGRSRVAPDAEIRLAGGRRVAGFLPGRLPELDQWAARSLHRPRAVRRSGRGRPRITEPTGAQIAELVESGMSLREVAAATGLSHETARTRYREHTGR